MLFRGQGTSAKSADAFICPAQEHRLPACGAEPKTWLPGTRGYTEHRLEAWCYAIESFDLLADSGLSNAKLFCRSGEALLFGDGREVKKIAELHSEPVIDSTDYSKRKAIFHKS
jgi:hypothetical protein